MRNMLVLFRRELAGYFATPVAYVFIFFFLVLMGGLTFNLANFYERGQADEHGAQIRAEVQAAEKKPIAR